jgi:hypothetical protein
VKCRQVKRREQGMLVLRGSTCRLCKNKSSVSSNWPVPMATRSDHLDAENVGLSPCDGIITLAKESYCV